MGRLIDIVDPEYERKLKRQRRVLILAGLASLALFGYPMAKGFQRHWDALKAARKLALYLSMIKTRAILTKTPLEAKFKAPDTIEVYETSSCGPNAVRTKLWDASLRDFELDIQFVPEPWVRRQIGSKEPILPRFCYDPLYGSSVHADGLAHGAVFLAHREDLSADRSDHFVQMNIEGTAGDLDID